MHPSQIKIIVTNVLERSKHVIIVIIKKSQIWRAVKQKATRHQPANQS